MKTKSDGNWRGEKNEAKEEPLGVNNTRVTKFRTRTDHSRIEGNCKFHSHAFNLLSFRLGGWHSSYLVFINYYNTVISLV